MHTARYTGAIVSLSAALALLWAGCSDDATPCADACPTGFVCNGGKCELSCSSGTTDCSGKCADTLTDAEHCGACGKACATGEVCKGGKCELSCSSGTTNCSGKCANTLTDAEHCGACSKSCASGEVCKAGKCVANCPKGFTDCSGVCVNTSADAKNCGACAKACKVSEVCTSGKCALACGPGQTQCSSSCVDTKTSATHCGKCDNACATGKTCAAGACKCPSGQTDCGGTCTNTSYDVKNCGACAKACASGQVCSSGTCGTICKVGETNCAGSCVNTLTDAKHCGKCAKACASGYGCCSAACANFQTDNKNCGKCGTACASPKTCVKGACACPSGKTDCSGKCVDTLTDVKNCGKCATACASGQVCIKGACSQGWATGLGAVTNVSNEYIYDLERDAQGNTYALGWFNREITQGSVTLSSKGYGYGLFVAKFNAAGKLLWASKGVSSSITTYKLAVDAAGNAYVTGLFQGPTAAFGSHTIKNASSSPDVFVAKLDKAGKWLWATAGGGTGSEYGRGVGVDASGNVYVSGYFSTSTGKTTKFGATTLTATNSDVFVAKLDKTGKWLWAVKAGGPHSDLSHDLTVDPSGNPIITGYFFDKLTFGTTTLTVKGGTDAFVAKLNPSGTWLWAASGGGPGVEYAHAVTVDSAGDAYIAGRHRKGAKFGTTTLPTSGSSFYNTDLYVAKIDKTGKWVWATAAGSTSSDYAYDLDLDSANNAYVSGYFRSSATFGATTLTSKGGADAFVAKLDKNGKWLWASGMGGSGSEYGYGVAVNAAGTMVRVAGVFSSTATFGATTLTSAGASDPYLATLGSTGAVSSAVAYPGNASSMDYGWALARDAAGNTYVAGTVTGGLTLGGSTLGTQDSGLEVFIGKLDPGGKWLWVSLAGGKGSDYGQGIGVDGAGNVYVTGYFSTAANAYATFGSTKLQSKGKSDLFVAKLDKSGKWLWAKRAGGTNSEYAGGLAVDSAGNATVTGNFYSTSASFGTHSLKSKGSRDIFVAMIDKSGTWKWASRAGSTSTDLAEGVALDSSGNAYVTGAAASSADFGKDTLTTKGSQDLFVAKLDKTGKWLWVAAGGGTYSDYGNGVAVDGAGNAHVAGYLNSSTGTFGAASVTSAGGSDVVVAKVDKTGKWLWARTAGGTDYDYAQGIDVDSSGGVFITGYFYEKGAFGATNLTALNGDESVFVAKLDKAGKWLWARGAKDLLGYSYGYDVKAGPAGSAYITGDFYSTVTFHKTTLVSEGKGDLFVWLLLP